MIKRNNIKTLKRSWRTATFFCVAVLLHLTFPKSLLATYPEEQPSARAASLGYGVVAIAEEWSLFYNQASLGFLENSWVGVHHENRFISPDLSFSAVGGIWVAKPGALGFSVKRLGFSKFSQTQAGLAFGMKLLPNLAVGVQANFHHVYVAGEYGSTSAFSAEGGILYTPGEKLSVGLHFFNPTRSKIYDDERMPTKINLGLAYKLSDMVLVTSGVGASTDSRTNFMVGVEFSPIKSLYFRTGVMTEPSTICFGMGYNVKSLKMDIAFSRNEYLGFTPHVSLSYQFGSKKEKRADESETI
ncbi:MAG TPA: hypothetical protein PLE67_04950 [Tenuifilaceae bacterium]|nr:hypothetical protein [Tenuifilaceae bacterium]HPE17804.1 hypothetical protein [Tenuifilaceae bacterium]HPQ33646.1 hypothetical protein [Tenuifilaceae bacterium]